MKDVGVERALVGLEIDPVVIHQAIVMKGIRNQESGIDGSQDDSV